MMDYYDSRDLIKEKTAFICKFLDVLAADIYPDDYDNVFNKNKKYIAINPEDSARIVDNILKNKDKYIEIYGDKTTLEKEYINNMFEFLERFNYVTSKDNAFNVRGIYDCSSILLNNFKSYSITNRIVLVQVGIYAIDIMHEIIDYENMNSVERDYTKEIDCRCEIMFKLEKILEYISMVDSADSHVNDISRIHRIIIDISTGIKNGWMIDDLMALYFIHNYCYEYKICYDKYYDIKNKTMSDLDIVEDLEVALEKVMRLEKNINEETIENLKIRESLLEEAKDIMLEAKETFYKLINILDKYLPKNVLYLELDEVNKVIDRSINKKIYPSELKMIEMIKNMDILTNSIAKSVFDNARAFDELEVNLEGDLSNLRRLLKYGGEHCSDSPCFEDFKDAYTDMLEYSEELFDSIEDVDFKRLSSCMKKLEIASTNCKAEMEKKGFNNGARMQKAMYSAVMELIDVIEERKESIQKIKITKFENEMKMENKVTSTFNNLSTVEERFDFLLDLTEAYEKNLIVNAEKKAVDQLLTYVFDEKNIQEIEDGIGKVLKNVLVKTNRDWEELYIKLKSDEKYMGVDEDLLREIALFKVNLSSECKIEILNRILNSDKTNLNENQLIELKGHIKETLKQYVHENGYSYDILRLMDHRFGKDEVEKLNVKLKKEIKINREEEKYNGYNSMIERLSNEFKSWRKIGINPVRQIRTLLDEDIVRLYDIMGDIEDESQAERIMDAVVNNNPIGSRDYEVVLAFIKEYKIKVGEEEWG